MIAIRNADGAVAEKHDGSADALVISVHTLVPSLELTVFGTKEEYIRNNMVEDQSSISM